jgi:hypothetical protein
LYIQITTKSIYIFSFTERLTCFREDYRNCFPIHKNAVDFLQVPSLDEILEPMIRTLHGPKAVKNWDKHKQLFTQPLKQIENLAFQGQVAAFKVFKPDSEAAAFLRFI